MVASQTMRVAQYQTYGGPEVLQEGSVAVPTPAAGEVLVRVHAASVNGIDLIIRSGTLRLFTGRKFPRGTGLDFAGEIAAVGPGAAEFAVGDRVWGCMPHSRNGSVAEFVCVPAEQLALAPKNLDLVQTAALPAVGSTALIALRDIAKLKAGDRLLVRGASGGVGSIAVQLGRAMGAHVTGLASARNLDFVRELGADVALDYAVARPAELGRFDAILDTVGSDTLIYRRHLTRHGRMMTICPDPARPMSSMLSIAASSVFGSRRIRFFSAKPRTELLADLATRVDSQAVKPLVDAVYPLARIADAHRAMAAGGRRGKQVIRLLPFA